MSISKPVSRARARLREIYNAQIDITRKIEGFPDAVRFYGHMMDRYRGAGALTETGDFKTFDQFIGDLEDE